VVDRERFSVFRSDHRVQTSGHLWYRPYWDCIVLYCTVLYCTVLYCTVLYWQSRSQSRYSLPCMKSEVSWPVYRTLVLYSISVSCIHCRFSRLAYLICIWLLSFYSRLVLRNLYQNTLRIFPLHISPFWMSEKSSDCTVCSSSDFTISHSRFDDNVELIMDCQMFWRQNGRHWNRDSLAI
jgi:hypothetical protein